MGWWLLLDFSDLEVVELNGIIIAAQSSRP